MKNKVFNVIGIIIISITIILFSIFIGANEREMNLVLTTILLALNFIYLIVKKIITKDKIFIKSKIDVYVIIFILCTTFPLIFKTYCSLTGTIYSIIKYIFLYSFYILVRNVIKDKKNIDVISIKTILSSLIVLVFGLDMLWNNSKIFGEILKKINVFYIYTLETRPYLSTTFGYRNTTAIYFAFCMFLAINLFKTHKSKFIKLISAMYIVLSIIAIYLTGSRFGIILTCIFIIIYYILYYKEKIKQNKMKILKIGILALLILIILLTILLTYFAKKSTIYKIEEEKYVKSLNYKFKPNTEYVLDVEIESENNKFEADIIEMNKYYNGVVLARKDIENINENIKIKFTTTENLSKIDFSIINPSKKEIVLKKFYINGEECIQHFKYIPDSLGKIIKQGILEDPSIIQRFDFWEDSLKIAKEHPIVGQGGNTWLMLSRSVQEYPYYSKATHSYFFELLIEYGIIGVSAFIALTIIFIKKYKYNKETLAIFIGILLVLFHSITFDFNMSFMLIQILVWGYMAAVCFKEKEEFPKRKIDNLFEILIFIGISIILIILIIGNIAKYTITDIKTKKELAFYEEKYQFEYIFEANQNNCDAKFIINEIQELINKNSYNMQNELYMLYWFQIQRGINDFSESELIEYITFINNKYQKVKYSQPMYITRIMERVEPMVKGYVQLVKKNFLNEELKKQIEILGNIIKNEYEINKKNIEDTERNGLPKELANVILEKYENSIDLIENYL